MLYNVYTSCQFSLDNSNYKSRSTHYKKYETNITKAFRMLKRYMHCKLSAIIIVSRKQRHRENCL